jgi:Kef-type K+ transport system membrane component KefB
VDRQAGPNLFWLSGMPTDPRARALLANVVAYVVVIALMAAVNLWRSPDNLWFIWVALGWGIGVAAHALAFVLRRTHRRERVFSDPKTRAFTVHLFAYVAVIALLFVVNLVATPRTWWFYWVALGWGAGLVANAWAVFDRSRTKESVAAAPKADTQPKREVPAVTARATPKKLATPRKRSKPKS